MTTKPVHAFTNDALGDHDATGIAELIRSREMRAEDAVRASIARARKINPLLEAIEYEAFEKALEDARAPRDGVFGGVPTFVKDNADVGGMPARHGTLATTTRPCAKNGAFVSQFLQLGFTVLGKSRLPEFGFNATTEFSGRAPARNPWNTDCSTGGSSGGGSALVASGVVPIAHANDGGGSIRIPASCCGLVGLKPTRGRFIDGELARSLPVNIVGEGVVTRSVRDQARFFRGMEQAWRNGKLPEIGDVTGPGRKRLRIGLIVDSITGIPTCPETRRVIDETRALLEGLGHRVEPMPVPAPASFIDDFTLYWAFLAFSLGTFGKLLMSRDFDAGKFEPFSRGLASYFKKRMMRAPGMLYRLRRSFTWYERAMEGYDA
ncbi:MAG TPA: amidase, partial [Spirochaetota bacterium]|nr:amidase [Spirochaetota bacterium]